MTQAFREFLMKLANDAQSKEDSANTLRAGRSMDVEKAYQRGIQFAVFQVLMFISRNED